MKIWKLLKELGFEHLTGPLWEHKDYDITITVASTLDPTDLALVLWNNGRTAKQNEILKTLGLK